MHTFTTTTVPFALVDVKIPDASAITWMRSMSPGLMTFAFNKVRTRCCSTNLN